MRSQGLLAIFGSSAPLLGLLPMPFALPAPVRTLLARLMPLRGPLAAFGLMQQVMPLVLPGLWRTIQYWQRLVPIIARFVPRHGHTVERHHHTLVL